MLKSSPLPNPITSPVLAPNCSQSRLRQALRRAYIQCRQSTLSLVQTLEHHQLCRQAHADFSPVGWHVGHIAYTEALWILEKLAGHPPLFPHYHRLFAADGLPKAERQNLPDLETLYAYLTAVRHKTFDYLETAPVSQQERIWRFLLQHESQHCETMTLVTEMLKLASHPVGTTASPYLSTPSGQISAIPKGRRASMVQIPAGAFKVGSDAPDALDNERPAHSVHVDDVWMDSTPVTCREFQDFIAAGGYGDRQWWSPDGWSWLQNNPITQPLYWTDAFIYENHPVCGVSWYEADAYARFAGKRLPTEAEWEKAARWNPDTGKTCAFPWGDEWPEHHHSNHGHHVGSLSAVDCYPTGASPVGCLDMLGNVWEWTASIFESYPGFCPYPYTGYSQTYFDGKHYVLRGGSWATQPWTLRPSFRNWYHPWTRQILAGFRCASSSPIEQG